MRLTVKAAIRQLHADLAEGIASVNSNRKRLIDPNSLACVLEATKNLITDRVNAYWRGEQERILATEDVANIEDLIANFRYYVASAQKLRLMYFMPMGCKVIPLVFLS